ncbi:DUF3034 family protein [Novosphingobium sp.]|uniref:DUF3034 family protein n=1 Tax=Novosphingobium sp. TaxID=1874826 RepID=UPI0025F3FB1B|nr:DUF3034 family protein [Novosphingobium sp.]
MIRMAALLLVCSGCAGPALAGESRSGGKLMLTGGVSAVEGSAGGGLATWAVIAGNETEDGIGGSAHTTLIELPDFRLTSFGGAIGWHDRVEISYAHQTFDTRDAGAALGLGRGYTFGQDIFGAKVRLFGDAVWGQDTVLPQVSLAVQHKRGNRRDLVRALGAKQASGTDFVVSATKVILSKSLVVGGAVRFTKANQFGLLGFGGDRRTGRNAQFEGSAGLLVTPSLVLGAEFRSKPDNLRFAKEDDSYDLFAAWSISHHVAVTAAYADLGEIATFRKQRGLFVSLQGSF